MVNVLKKMDWSDSFLLPLTGLKQNQRFKMKTHLFWDKYNIEDYKLILSFSSDDYYGLMEHCRNYVFPTLDKNGYLLENYDIDDMSIYILDMSEWAKDIEMFIAGKYSKFSKEAKNMIEKYHTVNNKLGVSIKATLFPNMPMDILDGKTAIEYVAMEYGLMNHLEEMKKIGEIGSLFDRESETLLIKESWEEVKNYL